MRHVVGDEDVAHPMCGAQRLGHPANAFDQESACGDALLAKSQLARGGDPLVVRGGDGLSIALGQAADSLAGAGCAGTALRATSTSALNAAGSLTASSARFLRSTSTPAALRPWTKRL